MLYFFLSWDSKLLLLRLSPSNVDLHLHVLRYCRTLWTCIFHLWVSKTNELSWNMTSRRNVKTCQWANPLGRGPCHIQPPARYNIIWICFLYGYIIWICWLQFAKMIRVPVISYNNKNSNDKNNIRLWAPIFQFGRLFNSMKILSNYMLNEK